jgi:hypothetical protein
MENKKYNKLVGKVISEMSSNINMFNTAIREVKVVNWEDVGLNYEVCDELYGDMTGKDIEGRMLSVGFWKGAFDSASMLSKISELDDDVLIEFERVR